MGAKKNIKHIYGKYMLIKRTKYIIKIKALKYEYLLKITKRFIRKETKQNNIKTNRFNS